ncbi:hypothetical protein CT676_42125 [Bradyrhizobium sp. MOS001]|uniref:hypothetical protein n=1 Tax=unclassified Bradyrhizobium TaxID=2631580 RepID=UPI00107553A9|nr:hypothetical protein [Bradyrhizobium sp. MOS001]TFW52597.1 hypothetical protein CT676_42125 [Bradyrhizobium sp. MOS001]
MAPRLRPQTEASSLLSENLRIESGRNFENGPGSITNFHREMLPHRTFYDRIASGIDKSAERHVVRRDGTRYRWRLGRSI